MKRMGIEQLLHYIEANLNSELSLTHLAELSHYSPFHLQRLFKEKVGESPFRYVQRLRLEYAANNLLYNPIDNITTLSYDLNFSSPATFSRAFKQHFKLNPKKFKNRKKSKVNIFKIDYTLEGQSNNEDLKRWIENNALITTEYIRAQVLLYKRILISAQPDNPQKFLMEWKEFLDWVHTQKLIQPETQMLGINLDNPLVTPAGMSRFYICITLPAELEKKVLEKTSFSHLALPASKYLRLEIKISQEELQRGLLAEIMEYMLTSYFQQNKLSLNGIPYIQYPEVSLPQVAKDLHKFKIYIPIKKYGTIYNH